MPQSTCHHILANGALCQAAPLRNRDYCRFHLQQIGRRMKAARTRARQQAPSLKLPLLEDLYSVQVALMQLADAIAYREIDPQSARLLTTVLRLAMQNLKSRQAWDRSAGFQSAVSEATPTIWDTFEQEHDLPAGLDLSLDPEVAFPPTEETSGASYLPGLGMSGNDSPLRAKIGQILREAESAPTGGVTADQVELMDVWEQEGQPAMLKLASEQLRNQKRRERRARRVYYEQVARNRNIRFAAQKLAAEQLKAGPAPQASPLSVSEEVAEVEARFTRRPPQREASMVEQTADSVAGVSVS